MSACVKRILLLSVCSLLLCYSALLHKVEANDRDLRIPFDLTRVQVDLGLARELGTVTDANLTTSGVLPEYILVQDVHKHPEVQSRISDIVQFGYHHWGIRKVFMEGAFAPVDLYLYQALPERLRVPLLARQIQDGDLTGPELAAILLSEDEMQGTYTTPFQLIGMEDPQLYRRNLEAYQRVEARRERALAELQAIAWKRRAMQLVDSPAYDEQLTRTQLLIELKLTPAQYTDYLKNKVATPSSPTLDPVIEDAEHFYQLVYERSEIFLRHARKKVPAAPGSRMLVVGGFHTAVMAEHLRLEGRSFVVITPRVTQSGYEPLYQKHMWESMSTLRVVKLSGISH